jgi:hypothetical protein
MNCSRFCSLRSAPDDGALADEIVALGRVSKLVGWRRRHRDPRRFNEQVSDRAMLALVRSGASAECGPKRELSGELETEVKLGGGRRPLTPDPSPAVGRGEKICMRRLAVHGPSTLPRFPRASDASTLPSPLAGEGLGVRGLRHRLKIACRSRLHFRACATKSNRSKFITLPHAATTSTLQANFAGEEHSKRWWAALTTKIKWRS